MNTNCVKPDINTAKIHYLLVISPPKIGKKRLKKFKKHIASYRGTLPPLIHIEGVDKNLVNFENFHNCINDNRNWVAKLKLFLGIEKYQLKFEDKSKCFTKLKTPNGKRWEVGTICCALSHLQAWEFVAKAPGYCLILEDDAFIRYDIDFNNILLPCKDADLISILKTKIHNYEDYSETFVKLLPQRHISANREEKNAGFSGYFLSPVGANKLLQKIMPINSAIDSETYRLARYVSIKMFATMEDWVIDMGKNFSLIRTKNISLEKIKNLLRNARSKITCRDRFFK
jgi:GR25 family glycosyltransferase involved in LPS biosynthesis